MTVEFPAPAVPFVEQPGHPANPHFPVYEPTGDRSKPGAPFPPDPPAAPANPPANPLGDYHKVAGQEPGNERELLFTIAGKPLYAPHEDDIDPAIGFRLIRDMRKFGPQIATMNAFGELLGDEALDLLCDAPKMSKKEWVQIMDVLREKVFSKFEDHMPGGKD